MLDDLLSFYVTDYYPKHDYSMACERLTNDIQKVIDRYYLPKPLFEDGEPVQFGDWFYDESAEEVEGVSPIQQVININLSSSGSFIINESSIYFDDERVKRPEGDSQDMIDNETFMSPKQYCKKYKLENYCGWSGDEVNDLDKKIMHLLERQQKLDESENGED